MSKLVVRCLNDVVNETLGERYFTKDDWYIAEAIDNSLYAIDNTGQKNNIAASGEDPWRSDEWFVEHFVIDEPKTRLLNRHGQVKVEKTLYLEHTPLTKSEPAERMLFKYNEDDILEILTEHLAERNGFQVYNSKAVLKGKASENLRLLCVVGRLEDEAIDTFDLEEADQNTDFNGTHS